jgi:hypothetical protein
MRTLLEDPEQLCCAQWTTVDTSKLAELELVVTQSHELLDADGKARPSTTREYLSQGRCPFLKACHHIHGKKLVEKRTRSQF